MNDAAEVDKLKAFVQDELLEELESRTGGFNIFTALSLERAEIRHSNVLAWLLDPRSSHGLGDYFLKAFLRYCSRQPACPGASFPSVFELDSWDLDDVEVLREWRKTDILLIDRTHKFVVLVENKIDSGEHGEQLRRYREIVQLEFRELRDGYIYLTVQGDEPSDKAYLSMTYGELLPLLHKMLETRQSVLGHDVATFITHYIHMVERSIVQESDIQEICRQIYKRHRDAIELILSSVPTASNRPIGLLEDVLRSDPDIIMDESTKRVLRFTTQQLDWIPRRANGFTSSGRILLFQVGAGEDELELTLYIVKGDPDTRKALYDACQGDSKVFNKAHHKLSPVWFCLHKSSIATLDEIEEASNADATDLLKERLDAFKKSVFIPMAEKLARAKSNLMV